MCGLWSLTPDKMTKRQEQVIATDDNPNSSSESGSPPTSPFTSPMLLQNGLFTITRTQPTSTFSCLHISASATPFLKKTHQPVKTLFIYQSSINASYFKTASLVFPSQIVSLTFLNPCWTFEIFFSIYYDLGIIPCAEGKWSWCFGNSLTVITNLIYLYLLSPPTRCALAYNKRYTLYNRIVRESSGLEERRHKKY